MHFPVFNLPPPPRIDRDRFLNIGTSICLVAAVNAINQTFWKNHTISNITKLIGIGGSTIGGILAIPAIAAFFFTVLVMASRTVPNHQLVPIFDASAEIFSLGAVLFIVSQIALATLRMA